MTDFERAPDPLPPERFFDLRGRTALVVGTGRPLGLAIAAALAEAGADVAVAGLTNDDLEMAQVNSAANLVWSLGRRNLVLPMDATDPASVEACVQQVDDAWGRIDILVNAQDLLFAMPFDETGRDEWDAVIAAKLTSGSAHLPGGRPRDAAAGLRPGESTSRRCWASVASPTWPPTPPPTAACWRSPGRCRRSGCGVASP